MMPKTSRSFSWSRLPRKLAAVVCAVLLLPGEGLLLAQGTAPAPAVAPEATKLPPEQLDSLVAPIALYADPLLAQTLVASTYPLEIIQLQQWLLKNPKLKDKVLADAVAKQPWDPAIQSMAVVPEVVKRLADDISWTTDLGNAFLEQQGDVMDAVQRMRKIAKDKGALVSNEQQKVETEVVEQKTVIVVQPSNPEIIYVPSYSPVVVYGPPVYAYPPIYYPPPPPPGAYFMTFAVGVAWGAAIWGGSCCGCGWGHSNNNVNINVNNNYNRNNINTGNIGGGNNNWNHNPSHRGAAPYSNKATANKYGGSAKGQSPGAKQQPAGGSRGGSGASAKQQPASGSRGGSGASAKQQPAGGSRGGAPSPSASNRGGSSGGSKIGNQSIPKSSASRGGGGYGGGSGGYSGSSARSSSSRGSSSMGGSRGGGSRGGGGGRGGGGRR